MFEFLEASITEMEVCCCCCQSFHQKLDKLGRSIEKVWAPVEEYSLVSKACAQDTRFRERTLEGTEASRRSFDMAES